ncbi:hypothetical protein [Streptomyces sp. NPDC020951]|uniref:hypothetical protein n=1 Tax=Streptomyces sp. NPDC020951 TaxID=3365104 RepID=UPI00378AD93A
MSDEPQPEPAGLPDTVTGPYLRERVLQGAKFQHTSAEIASIVYYDGGGCSLVTSQGTEQLVPRRYWARPVSVCEIARGRHTTVFTVDLPTANGATFFPTKVTLRWEVTDYQRVAHVRLASIESDLGPEIVSRLRQVSGLFAVEDVQRANQAILAETETDRWADFAADVGLHTRLFVEVDTDEMRKRQVAEAREEAAQRDAVARRLEEFAHLPTGSAEGRLTYLMAMGDREDVADVIAMMREDEAQGRRETQEFFLRMLEQGRITSPELEAFLRTRVLASLTQGGFAPPAVPGPAVPGPFVPPPRELPMPQPPPRARREPEPEDAPPWPRSDLPESHAPDPHEPPTYRPEPYRPDPHRPEPYRPDPHRPEPYRPEPYRPESYAPESSPPDDARRRRRDDDYWNAAPEGSDGDGR